MNSGKFVADQQSCMAVETAMCSEWIINTIPLLFVLSASTYLTLLLTQLLCFLLSFHVLLEISGFGELTLFFMPPSTSEQKLNDNYSQPHQLQTISKAIFPRSVSLTSHVVDNINLQVLDCG